MSQARQSNQHSYKGYSQLAAIRVDNIDDSLEWFGNYTSAGETPIILIPERSSCKPYVYVPEGTHAVITKHGKFDQVKSDGGLVWCLPWTKIQFLVTQQNITYQFQVRACPTYDNIFVGLGITVVFKCMETQDDIFNFVYRISINQLNEQLEAAITERVRVLIRGKTHLEVYNIKGPTNTNAMKDFLNDMFRNKGLKFTDIIITEVSLPQEIKDPLDQKAQFGSLNELEREKYNFEMKLIDDEEELQATKQRRYEQRDSINEDFSKQLTLKKRELEIIRANAKKSVAEINAQAMAEVAQIQADSELKNEQIKGETLVTKTIDETKGQCEAEITEIEAKNDSSKKIAAKMLEVADTKADTINTIGNGEAAISNVMQSRRKYEHLNKKLEVISAFKDNRNLKIFGDQKDDVLSQMAAYRISQDGNGAIK